MNYVQGAVASDLFISTEVYIWAGRVTKNVPSTSVELCSLPEAHRHLLQCSLRQWLLAIDSQRDLLILRVCTSTNTVPSREIIRLGAILVSKGG